MDFSAYVGDPKIDESRQLFVHGKQPNTELYYKHRMATYENLRARVPAHSHKEREAYNCVTRYWEAKLLIMQEVHNFLEKNDVYWVDWRERYPLDLSLVSFSFII